MKNLLLRSSFFATAAILTFFAMGFKTAGGTTPEKITICHVPPGNPDNCQQITISLNALEAHLEHGDNLVCSNEDELDFYHHLLKDHVDRHPDAHTQILWVGPGHQQ